MSFKSWLHNEITALKNKIKPAKAEIAALLAGTYVMAEHAVEEHGLEYLQELKAIMVTAVHTVLDGIKAGDSVSAVAKAAGNAAEAAALAKLKEDGKDLEQDLIKGLATSAVTEGSANHPVVGA